MTRAMTLLRALLILPIGASIISCTQSPANKVPLEVALPRDCEMLAANVPAPELRAGMNAKVALARTGAALATANDNLTATRECQAAQRQALASDPAK